MYEISNRYQHYTTSSHEMSRSLMQKGGRRTHIVCVLGGYITAALWIRPAPTTSQHDRGARVHRPITTYVPETDNASAGTYLNPCKNNIIFYVQEQQVRHAFQ